MHSSIRAFCWWLLTDIRRGKCLVGGLVGQLLVQYSFWLFDKLDFILKLFFLGIPELDLGSVDFQNTVSCDGDLVCIAAQLFHYRVRWSKRDFGIDVPLFEFDCFEDGVFVTVPVNGTVLFQPFHKHGLEHVWKTFLGKRHIVPNGRKSASNPLLHIHAKRYPNQPP